MRRFFSLPVHWFQAERPAVGRRRVRLALDTLEERAVPAIVGPEWRSIDGSGNNLANPSWGQAGTDYIRVAPAAYADGVSSPAGADRPGAREISNSVADQQGQSTVSDRLMSAMVYAWGQFIDHDLDLTQTGTTESLPIPVPSGDPSFDPAATGTQLIPMKRSTFDAATGANSPRQQVNSITAWLDGSMIYGSDAATAGSLRTMQGGLLKTSAGNLLPTDSQGNFLAGDVRVGENPELTSLQTLFVREHNRWAIRLANANPGFTDEQLYQGARARVIAEVQVITYKEWLPALLGQNPLKPYAGYKPGVNPSISNEFATAGFRFGHSIVGPDIEFLDNNGNKVADPVSLAQAFFNPSIVKNLGIDPVLKYLASDPSQEVDLKVVDQLRNFLFGAPGQGGLDLASLNIQRGRDHGLADYNATRVAYGLPRLTDFSQITTDAALQSKLRQLYGSVDKIDLWVGVLAERHVAGGSVGATARAIIADQFTRIRDADRFWYQNQFKGKDLQVLENTSLAEIIAANTTTTNLQRQVFFFRPEITGVAFGDRNGDGKLGKGETGVARATIQLVDAATGAVVATTASNGKGEYRFGVGDGLRLGVYQVRAVLDSGAVVNGPVVSVTKGDHNPRAQLALPVQAAPPQPVPPAQGQPPKPPAPAPKPPAPASQPGALAGINQVIGALPPPAGAKGR